jgi:NADH-quinone oxidoreductase subunit C
MDSVQYAIRIRQEFGDEAVLQNRDVFGQATVEVAPQKIVAIAQWLHGHPDFYFDSLSCLTGIDNGVAANTMEIVYQLYSIPHHAFLALKVTLPREKPVVASVAQVWRTADWHEREAFDMFGIIFENHPDLRRILMPADWQGFPLRKDYQPQELYHDIKVKY